jgi:hypothetical protein
MQEHKEPDLIDLVQSSVHEIDLFEKSIIWSDMVNILKDWSEGLKEEYDNAKSMEDVKFTQGISICIQYLLKLPESMRLIVQQAQEDKNES